MKTPESRMCSRDPADRARRLPHHPGALPLDDQALDLRGQARSRPPEQAAVRETKEEINIDIKEPTKDDIIFVDYQGLHTFICYLVSVKSGEVKKGDEIFEVKAFSLKELEASLKIGAMRILSRNHANSFEAFLEKRKKRAREAENV